MDELGKLLGERDPYLPDGDFTARTLARLPTPGQRRRRLILGLAFGLALLTATWLFPALLPAASAWLNAQALSSAVHALMGLVPLMIFAVLVAAAVFFTVTRDETS
jgi:hypothetical protein